MSQKQIKRARREIRAFCAEQHERIKNNMEPLDPRVLGGFPAKLVNKTVGKFINDEGVAETMKERGIK